ncbi:MAG: hypothetical protein LBS14_01070 [Holosporaceae bacterium]|jgi:hypothetical protein|nr:hypothetical protein [Holosporaceae bacterium]
MKSILFVSLGLALAPMAFDACCYGEDTESSGLGSYVFGGVGLAKNGANAKKDNQSVDNNRVPLSVMVGCGSTYPFYQQLYWRPQLTVRFCKKRKVPGVLDRPVTLVAEDGTAFDCRVGVGIRREDNSSLYFSGGLNCDRATLEIPQRGELTTRRLLPIFGLGFWTQCNERWSTVGEVNYTKSGAASSDRYNLTKKWSLDARFLLCRTIRMFAELEQ